MFPHVFFVSIPFLLIANAEAGESGRRFCIMNLEAAKRSLENEINEPGSNIQEPFKNKYATWKIIDYLWASNEHSSLVDSIDWLKTLYMTAGMTDENMARFSLNVELIIQTINRNRLNSN